MGAAKSLVELNLPAGWRHARHALTSIPWPTDRDDVPAAIGVDHQIVQLFEPQNRPRLMRFLLLAHDPQSLPQTLHISGGDRAELPATNFSTNFRPLLLRISISQASLPVTNARLGSWSAHYPECRGTNLLASL